MDLAGGQQIAWMALSTGTQCHSGVTEPGMAHRNAAVNSTCSRVFSLVITYFRGRPSKGQTALSTSYTMWNAFFFLKSPIEGKILLLCPFKDILYYSKVSRTLGTRPLALENPFVRPDHPNVQSFIIVVFMKLNSICIVVYLHHILIISPVPFYKWKGWGIGKSSNLTTSKEYQTSWWKWDRIGCEVLCLVSGCEAKI